VEALAEIEAEDYSANVTVLKKPTIVRGILHIPNLDTKELQRAIRSLANPDKRTVANHNQGHSTFREAPKTNSIKSNTIQNS